MVSFSKGISSVRWLLLLPVFSLTALEIKPWIGEPWLFNWLAGYTYGAYPDVEGNTNATPYGSHNQYIDLGLLAPLTPTLDVEFGLTLNNTNLIKWGFETVALQGRYQFMDDIQGDLISLTAGLSMRYVSPNNLRDPSCQYHKKWDFEAGVSAGKEWSQGPYWIARSFAWIAVGQGTSDYPWMRALLSLAGNIDNQWQGELFADSYFGFGNRVTVDPRDFHSYARIGHRSVDLGLRAGYKFAILGLLNLEGAYRVYARAYPERNYAITMRYRYPFSPV
jgi:hypothetical protein